MTSMSKGMKNLFLGTAMMMTTAFGAMAQQNQDKNTAKEPTKTENADTLGVKIPDGRVLKKDPKTGRYTTILGQNGATNVARDSTGSTSTYIDKQGRKITETRVHIFVQDEQATQNKTPVSTSPQLTDEGKRKLAERRAELAAMTPEQRKKEDEKYLANKEAIDAAVKKNFYENKETTQITAVEKFSAGEIIVVERTIENEKIVEVPVEVEVEKIIETKRPEEIKLSVGPVWTTFGGEQHPGPIDQSFYDEFYSQHAGQTYQGWYGEFHYKPNNWILLGARAEIYDVGEQSILMRRDEGDSEIARVNYDGSDDLNRIAVHAGVAPTLDMINGRISLSPHILGGIERRNGMKSMYYPEAGQYDYWTELSEIKEAAVKSPTYTPFVQGGAHLMLNILDKKKESTKNNKKRNTRSIMGIEGSANYIHRFNDEKSVILEPDTGYKYKTLPNSRSVSAGFFYRRTF